MRITTRRLSRGRWKERNMDPSAFNLWLWLPVLFLLGVGVLLLLFAFVAACERV
jgi:hypothetical protein